MFKFVVYILSLIPCYFVYRPFLKTKEDRLRLLKWHLILLPLGFLMYFLVLFIARQGTVKSFREGVELLEVDQGIIKKIGNVESYSFDRSWMPKETDNPATFRVSLKGDSEEMYVSCKVQKDSSSTWHLVAIHQDSLIKIKN